MTRETLQASEWSDEDSLRRNYEFLSAADKNWALVELFMQLPMPSSQENNPFARPAQSTYDPTGELDPPLKKHLATRMKILLSFTETTAQFQRYIVENFRSLYNEGIYPTELRDIDFFSKLFADYGDAEEGVFNATNARDIEQQIYSLYLAFKMVPIVLLDQKILEYLDRDLPGMIAAVSVDPSLRDTDPVQYDSDIAAIEQSVRDRDEFFKQWPHAFRELHGDEI